MRAAVALLALAAPLAAQQPPAPTAPAPAAQQQPLAPPPATHVVQQGETLWTLAQQFLGDPLLWPEIYRLNTAVVEDPHWIFPGEELRLAPAPDTLVAAAAPPAAAPAAPDTTAAPGGITVAPAAAETAAAAQPAAAAPAMFSGPTIFAAKQQTQREATATIELRSQQAYRAVRAGEHYAAGFLTDGETLNAGTLIGTSATASISRLTVSSSPQQFSLVRFTPPPGDSLAVGQFLLAYELSRFVPGHGFIVHPTGLVKVTQTQAAAGQAEGQVIALYEAMQGGQKLIPIAPFQSKTSVRPVPTDSGVVGHVVAIRDPHELLTMQDVVFIDVGERDSVRTGDIFALSDTATVSAAGETVTQDEGRVLIVYTRPASSTGIIIQLSRPDIRVGAAARQVRRMPS